MTATCGLSFSKINGVFVIGTNNQIAVAKSPAPAPTAFTFQGVLFDAESNAPLPNVIVQSPNGCILSGHDGSFSISSTKRSLHIRVKHLAYTT